MNTCVVIPTHNESLAIGSLVRQLREQKLNVVVVDDGSRDNTGQLAAESGAFVLKNVVNEGKGASLKKGFRYALEKGFDAVITMDGDGQHLPEDVPYFLRIASNSDKQVFIGNRMLGIRNMPLARVLTNKFMSWFLSKVIGQKVLDTQCGFRLIKKEALGRFLLKTSKYETESEMLIQASRLGFKIESVPVKTVYKGEKSQINPFVDTLRFIRFIIGQLRFWKR